MESATCERRRMSQPPLSSTSSPADAKLTGSDFYLGVADVAEDRNSVDVCCN